MIDVGSHDLHRLVVESLHDRAVMILDTQGHIASWNLGAARINGYDSAEILGRHFSVFYPPVSPGPTPDALLRQAEREGRAEVSGWRVRQDGSRFWAHVLVSPLRDETGQLVGFSKITQDRTEVYKAETAARREQEFNRVLVDTLAALVVVLDAEGRFVRFNPTCETLSGYSAREVVGRFPWDFLIPREQVTEVHAVFLDLSAGRFPNSFENDWVARDGRILRIRWSNTVLLDEAGQMEFVVATGLDLTDLRRAEAAERAGREERVARQASEEMQKALVAAVERYDLIARATNDIVWDWDLSSGQVSWNDALFRTTGYLREEVPPTAAWWELQIHPEDRTRVLSTMNVALEGRDTDWSSQYRFRRADGRYLWVLDRGIIVRSPAGAPTRMVGSIFDLTPQFQAEEDLHHSNQLLLERMKELRCLMLSSRILHEAGEEVDPALAEVMEVVPAALDPDRVVARLCLDSREFASGPFPEEGARLEAGVKSAGRERGTLAVACRGTAPPEFLAEERRALLSTLAERIGGALERAEALRDRRLLQLDLERRVEERTRELASANRELEAFAYSVSHDLRSPLRSLDGFSQALLEDFADGLPSKAVDYLHRIRTASQRMGTLIDDLLVLSRVTRSDLQPERLDLSAMVGELLEEKRAAEPDRQVEAVVSPGLVAVGDRRLVRVALANLVDNAWKFTSRNPVAHVQVGSEGGAFYVRDDGVGFDMAYAGKLFAPFHRLHGTKEFPGSGVGLATVQRVVGRHGGRVWAEAAPGEGATIYFQLGGAEG